MQYSPKLKKATEEIKEILLKYDIAGIVTLHTPGFAEYLIHITPSYSCAKLDNVTGKFELKGKKIHFANEEERLERLTATSNMLRLLAEVNGRSVLSVINISEITDNALNAEHGEEGHSSSTTQNN